MKRQRGLIAALLLLATVVLWWWSKPPAARSGPGTAGGAPAVSTPGIALSATHAPPPALERSTLADSLNAPSSDIRADLRVVASIVETFRTNFLQTGNPTGTNAEITAALTGRNRLQLALIPGDHPAINKAGELCDRWGTPFFFHTESATRMEIRSAGPDRKLWSEDDVVFSP
jgi:hypothetical protein